MGAFPPGSEYGKIITRCPGKSSAKIRHSNLFLSGIADALLPDRGFACFRLPRENCHPGMTHLSGCGVCPFRRVGKRRM
jgi:hypothetical protein